MRAKGPAAPGGFMTMTGRAGDREVHWIGDEKRAEKLEQDFAKASELLQLMIRNAYTLEGLSSDEIIRAKNLILDTPKTESDCDGGRPCREKAIGDTGLCRAHNLYALATRK
ncbi:MAG: hypothetical protein HYT39_03810 [Candidatus Sungbacteria bacterium]|nr:hypothetical protein [Candidatus Sungbacteria bacterium]